MTITFFAPAKINLALHVTGQRTDGYHLLDTLVVFADVGDRVSVGNADGKADRLRLTGPFATGLEAEADNLVLRAASAFRKRLVAAGGIAPPVDILPEKNLPVASRIGGGSADAAAARLVLAGAKKAAGVGEALVSR